MLAGDGGRKAPNKRIVLGRCDRLAPDRARRMAHQVLGKVASGDDPADERAEARGIPVLRKAFEEYIAANPNRTMRTDKGYRELVELHLRDWLSRPLDAITRRDVEARFNHLTAHHGWSQANATIALLRWIYRRPCVDLEGLRNPVDLWLAAGGKFHRRRRRKISSPAEVLPLWRAGIQAVVVSPVARDAFWFGLITGMRLNEVLALRWERVDREAQVFRVEETKTGVPLELPITRQLSTVLERRWEESGALPEGWVFPSSASGSGRLSDLAQHYKGIGEACGTRFWYHGLRNAFITVAERDLMLPASLTKRLVNHARPNDVTEGYAADWTIGQLRQPAQRIADRSALSPRTRLEAFDLELGRFPFVCVRLIHVPVLPPSSGPPPPFTRRAIGQPTHRNRQVPGRSGQTPIAKRRNSLRKSRQPRDDEQGQHIANDCMEKKVIPRPPL